MESKLQYRVLSRHVRLYEQDCRGCVSTPTLLGAIAIGTFPQSQGASMSDLLSRAPGNEIGHTEYLLRERIAELERQLAVAAAMTSPSCSLAGNVLPILDAIPIP